jgi:hypothetical protein
MPSTWGNLIKSNAFRALNHDQKTTVATNYFAQNIEQSQAWERLEAPKRRLVQKRFMRSIGNKPEEEVGNVESFWNSFTSALPGAAQMQISAIDFLGYLDWKMTGSEETFNWGTELRKDLAFESPSAGLTGLAGSGIGSAMPSLAAAGIAQAVPAAGQIAGVTILGLYAAMSASSAMRLVYDREKQTGENISPAAEMATIVGFGASTYVMERMGLNILKGATRGVAPKMFESLGGSLMARNIPEAVKTIGLMSGGESLEEGGEQILTNILTKLFVNPDQAVTEGLASSMFAGGIGGGVGYSPLFLSRHRARQNQIGLEQGEGPHLKKYKSTPPVGLPAHYYTAMSRMVEGVDIDPAFLSTLANDPTVELASFADLPISNEVMLQIAEKRTQNKRAAEMWLAKTRVQVPLLMAPAVSETIPLGPERPRPSTAVAERIKLEENLGRMSGVLIPEMAQAKRANVISDLAAGAPPKAVGYITPLDYSQLMEFTEQAKAVTEAGASAESGNGSMEISEIIDRAILEGHQRNAQRTAEPVFDDNGDVKYTINADISTALSALWHVEVAIETVEGRKQVPIRLWRQYETVASELASAWGLLNPDDVDGSRLVEYVNSSVHRRISAMDVAATEASVVVDPAQEVAEAESVSAKPTPTPATAPAPVVAEPVAAVEAPLTKPAKKPRKRQRKTVAAAEAKSESTGEALQKEFSSEIRRSVDAVALGDLTTSFYYRYRDGDLSLLEAKALTTLAEAKMKAMKSSTPKTQKVVDTVRELLDDVPVTLEEQQAAADAQVELTEETIATEPAAADIYAAESEVAPSDREYAEDGMIDEENLLFQYALPGQDTKQQLTLEQRERLLLPLQKAGLVKRAVQTPGQLTDHQNRPVNAILEGRSGTLYLSENIDLSTIGHEAFHQFYLDEKTPRVRALLNQIVEEHGIESSADIIGDFYAARRLDSGLAKRAGNWMSDMWLALKTDLGVDVGQEQLVQVINSAMRTNHDVQDDTLYRFQNKRYYGEEQTDQGSLSDTPESTKFLGNINLHRVMMDDVERARAQGRFGDSLKPDYTSDARLLADAEAYITRVGMDGMDQLGKRVLSGRGTSPIEHLALRLYSTTLFVEQLRQSTDLNDPAEVKRLEQLAEQNMQVVSKNAYQAGLSLHSHNIMTSPEAIMGLLTKLVDMKHPQLKDKVVSAILDGSIRDPQVLDDLVRRTNKPQFHHYLWQLWYSSKLSNPATHLVNTIVNAVRVGQLVGERALESGVDATLQTQLFQSMFPSLKGRSRTVFMDEVIPMWRGIRDRHNKIVRFVRTTDGKATMKAFAKGKVALPEDIFGNGVVKWQKDVGRAYEAWENSPHKWMRDMAPLISFPFKALQAMDLYFYSMASDAQLQALAIKENKNTGATVEELLANPSDAMMAEAGKFGRTATFTDHPGNVARALFQMNERAYGVTRVVIPFVNTLVNILKRGLEITPGIGVTVSRSSGDSNTLTIAKQVEGCILTGILLTAFNGSDDEEGPLITGPPERQQAKRDSDYRRGRTPYSIKVGNSWVSYRWAEPFATQMSAIGAYLNYEPQEGDDMFERFAGLTHFMTSSVIDNSFLNSAASLIEGPSGIERPIKSFPTGLVPYGGFLRAINQLVSAQKSTGGGTILYEGSGFLDQLANTAPGGGIVIAALANMLPGDYEYSRKEKLNNFGEVVELPGGGMRQWFPVRWTTESADPVEVELARLQVYPGLPSDTVTYRNQEVALDDQMYREYSILTGNLIKEQFTALMTQPGFKQAPDEMKVKHFSRVRAKIQRVARQQLLEVLNRQGKLPR